MTPSPDDVPARRATRRLGQSLAGRYSVLRLLGIGGTAAVYAGVHRNGHAVALKILHERLASDPEIERLFRREAQLANAIGHPGVVPIIDDDVTEDGCVFLVMPLLSGETLRARARRMGGTLPVEEVVAVAHALLEVLARAHARKIVHRDVKPENLFLTRAGELKVLDFGIGRFFEVNEAASATLSGRALGTPAFMAPEQALGRSRDVDDKTDLWAAGATMFTLLSGGFVHEAEGPGEVLVRAATMPAPSLQERAPGIPEEIRRVVDRALAFEKNSRWANAAEMDRALLEAFASCSGRLSTDLPALPVPDDNRNDDGLRPIDTYAPGDVHAVDTQAPAALAPLSQTIDNLPFARTEVLREPGDLSNLGVPETTDRAKPSRWSLYRLGPIIAMTAVGLSAVALASVARNRPAAMSTPTYAPSTGNPDLDWSNGAKETGVPPEAAAQFEAGLQAWADAALGRAEQLFERAIVIAPDYASAHAHLAFLSAWPDSEARGHFRRAFELRAALSPQERIVLEASEPAFRLPPDMPAARERLRHALTQADTALVRESLATVLMRAGDEDEALELLQAMTSTQPTPALVWKDIAQANIFAGRVPEARAALAECLKTSSVATTCLANLDALEANEGDCPSAEDTSRRAIALDSSSPWGFGFLARALAARGAPTQSVLEALEQQWLIAPPETRASEEASWRMRFAVLYGDFGTALHQSQLWNTAVQTRPDGASHAKAMYYTYLLDDEIDARADALHVADAYLARRDAWLPESYLDRSIWAVRAQYRYGAISRTEYARQRDAWIARVRNPGQLEQDASIWLEAFARAVRDDTDAREALASMPKSLPDPVARDASEDLPIGEVFLRAGDRSRAIPYLRRAASACTALDSPIEHTRSLFELGLALEASAPTEACTLYERVLQRWGAARQSVTAGKVRGRIAAMHCDSLVNP
jgi:serine/threonine protein kinase/Tfp pilus assembly protein PilF